MTRTTIGIADVEVEVGLQLVRFANGGSWSFCLCPQCGRRARTLKLFEGSVLCWRCCHRGGVRYRCLRSSLRGRAELRVPKLKGMLESKQSLRLKPVLRGTMERRSRLEVALRRCEFIVAQRGYPRKTKPIVDPCEEPDFKPPRRPWPRLKSKVSEPGQSLMAMFSRRPASLAHLSDEAAARALSKHFGDVVEAAKELGVDRKDLRRLTWSNPAILDAAHERMSLFVHHMWGEAVCGLNSKVASVRRRAVDRMLSHDDVWSSIC